MLYEASNVASFSEVFCEWSNALFATAKAGSEIVENGLLSGSERRKRLMAAVRWISLMKFCKLTEKKKMNILKIAGRICEVRVVSVHLQFTI